MLANNRIISESIQAVNAKRAQIEADLRAKDVFMKTLQNNGQPPVGPGGVPYRGQLPADYDPYSWKTYSPNFGKKPTESPYITIPNLPVHNLGEFPRYPTVKKQTRKPTWVRRKVHAILGMEPPEPKKIVRHELTFSQPGPPPERHAALGALAMDVALATSKSVDASILDGDTSKLWATSRPKTPSTPARPKTPRGRGHHPAHRRRSGSSTGKRP